MVDNSYRTSASCVFTLKYHLVLPPKYRSNMLSSEIAERSKDLLYEKAEEINVVIEAFEIIPDHVHLFVSADPTIAPQRLANQFKGGTSRILRKEFDSLRSRMPALWSRSYDERSVGHVSADAVKKKTQEQERRS